MKFKCKTHNVVLEYDEEKKIRRHTWTYGENPRCVLLLKRIEEITEGKDGDCEVIRL